MFPIEMWETILSELDVLDLLKFQRVSKTFHAIITGIIEKKCKWYEKCLKEIPEMFWSSLLRHQNHPEICCKDFHKSKKHSSIWMGMYKSWIGWNNLTEKTSSTKTFTLFDDEIEKIDTDDETKCINCTDALRNIVAIGDGTGGMIFYDLSKPNYEPFIQQSPSSFTENILLCTKGNIVAIGDGTGRMIFYDLSKPNYEPFIQQSPSSFTENILLCTKDQLVMAVASFTDPPLIQYWDVKSQKLTRATTGCSEEIYMGASYDFYCTVELSGEFDDHHILLIEQLEPDGQFKFVRSFIIPCERVERVVTVSMDGDKVMLITLDYEIGRLVIHEIKPDCDHCIFKSLPCDIQPYEFRFLDPSIVIRYNDPLKTHIGFSVAGKNWKFYNLKDDFHLTSEILSVLYYVGVLIMGLESGELCIIHVGDIKSVETFSSKMLKNAKRKVIKLDAKPIECIDVTEYDSNQFIVAATQTKVHIVKLE